MTGGTSKRRLTSVFQVNYLFQGNPEHQNVRVLQHLHECQNIKATSSMITTPLPELFRCVPVNLVKPLLDVVKRLLISHVVHHNNAVGSPVVRRRDGAEPFLPRGVPLFSQVNARIESVPHRKSWQHRRYSAHLTQTHLLVKSGHGPVKQSWSRDYGFNPLYASRSSYVKGIHLALRDLHRPTSRILRRRRGRFETKVKSESTSARATFRVRLHSQKPTSRITCEGYAIYGM